MRGKARQHREDKHGGSEHENVDDVFLGTGSFTVQDLEKGQQERDLQDD